MFSSVVDSAKTLLHRTPAPLIEGLDDEGNTPLHHAVLNGDKAISEQNESAISEIKHLLENPHYLQHQNQQKMTPLILAASKDQWLTVQLILSESIRKQDKRTLSTLFLIAVSANQIEVVQSLLQHGVDVNYKDPKNSKSALHLAVEKHLPGMLTLLVKNKANVFNVDKQNHSPIYNASTSDKWDLVEIMATLCPADEYTANFYGYPLLKAIHARRLDMVKILRDAGASFVSYNDGVGALALAIKNNDVAILDYLIKCKIELSLYHLTMSPIEYAAHLNHWPCVDALAKAKRANSSLQSIYGKILLRAAARQELNSVKSLIEAGTSLSISDTSGNTALHIAIHNNDTDMIRYLVKAGADLFAKNDSGFNPLRYAVTLGHWHLVQLIAEEKPAEDNKKLQTLYGCSLLEAAKQDQLPTVEVLYNAHASLTETSIDCDDSLTASLPQKENASTLEYWAQSVSRLSSHTIHQALESLPQPNKNTSSSLLHLAVKQNNVAMLEFFLRIGIDPTIKDKHQQTAIKKAAKEKKFNLVKLLAEHRFADKNSRDDYGYALFAAVLAKDEKTVEILSRVKMVFSYADSKGETVVHAAIRGGSIAVLTQLIQRGAPLSCPDTTGLTPIQLAANLGHWDQVILLTQHTKAKDDLDRYQQLLANIIDQKRFNVAYHFINNTAMPFESCFANGNTLLHNAILAHTESNDNFSTIIALFKLGFDLGLKNQAGQTCIEYAKEQGKADLVKKAHDYFLFERALPYLMHMHLSSENALSKDDLPTEIFELILNYIGLITHPSMMIEKTEEKTDEKTGETTQEKVKHPSMLKAMQETNIKLATISANCFIQSCNQLTLFPPVAEALREQVKNNPKQLGDVISALDAAEKDEETTALFEKFHLRRFGS